MKIEKSNGNKLYASYCKDTVINNKRYNTVRFADINKSNSNDAISYQTLELTNSMNFQFSHLFLHLAHSDYHFIAFNATYIFLNVHTNFFCGIRIYFRRFSLAM